MSTLRSERVSHLPKAWRLTWIGDSESLAWVLGPLLVPEALFSERGLDSARLQGLQRSLLTCVGWESVLDDGRLTSAPMHPVAPGIPQTCHSPGVSLMMAQVVAWTSCPHPEQDKSGVGPAPAQHLLSWDPLGMGSLICVGACGEGGVPPTLQKRKLRSERLMDLPSLKTL